jgi:thiamine-phosphate pyrophosphorylase
VQSPLICLVTGGGPTGGLLNLIRDAALAGVDLIQVREPGLDDRTLAALTREAVDAAQQAHCRVVVNDRLDIALAANAAGVHLRSASMSAKRVRGLVAESFLVGRSVHNRPEALAAAESGCDYLIFGTVFPSRSKPPGHPVAGLDQLHEIAMAVQIPVLAIGGISTENAATAIAAGAAGVAGIELFRCGVSVASTVSSLRRSFDT